VGAPVSRAATRKGQGKSNSRDKEYFRRACPGGSRSLRCHNAATVCRDGSSRQRACMGYCRRASAIALHDSIRMASGQVAANGNDCPGDVVTNTLAVGTQHDGCDRNPIFGRHCRQRHGCRPRSGMTTRLSSTGVWSRYDGQRIAAAGKLLRMPSV
jgi:hypothetical protein